MPSSAAERPARKAKKGLETSLMRAIHDTLVASGVTLWRNNCGVAKWDNGARTRYGLGLGSADLVGCYKGRFIAIEVKATTGQSDAQVCWQRAVERAGGLYVLAYDVETAVRAVLG